MTGVLAWSATRGLSYLEWLVLDHHRPPPTEVVFDDDPVAGHALLRTGGYEEVCGNRNGVMGPAAHPVARLYRPLGSLSDGVAGLLFLARRQTPGGASVRLYAGAGIYEGRSDGYRLLIVAGQITPATPWGESWWTHDAYFTLKVPPGCRLRLFAGHPDPTDLTHFTLGYELAGHPGTIDGWALDPEARGLPSVQLRVRDGPLSLGSTAMTADWFKN